MGLAGDRARPRPWCGRLVRSLPRRPGEGPEPAAGGGEWRGRGRWAHALATALAAVPLAPLRCVASLRVACGQRRRGLRCLLLRGERGWREWSTGCGPELVASGGEARGSPGR